MVAACYPRSALSESGDGAAAQIPDVLTEYYLAKSGFADPGVHLCALLPSHPPRTAACAPTDVSGRVLSSQTLMRSLRVGICAPASVLFTMCESGRTLRHNQTHGYSPTQQGRQGTTGFDVPCASTPTLRLSG